MSKAVNVAVVGATGLVGQTMIQILEQRQFPVNTLFPVASARSVGRTVRFRGEDVPVLALDDFDFSAVQLGLFSPGASISKDAVPRAVAAGAIGIFIHLQIHNIVDNLYVQGMYLHLALVLGLVSLIYIEKSTHRSKTVSSRQQ